MLEYSLDILFVTRFTEPRSCYAIDPGRPQEVLLTGLSSYLSKMIIRNCHKKYNLCRNDAAASPFGKGCHEVAGYVSNNHTLLNPKCFSINGSVEKS